MRIDLFMASVEQSQTENKSFWQKMADYATIAGKSLKIAGLAVVGMPAAVVFGSFFLVAEVGMKIVGTTIASGLMSIGAFVGGLGLALSLALRPTQDDYEFKVGVRDSIFRQLPKLLLKTLWLGAVEIGRVDKDDAAPERMRINPDYKESFAINKTHDWLSAIWDRITEECENIKAINKKYQKPQQNT
jgi:hypothetical protein